MPTQFESIGATYDADANVAQGTQSMSKPIIVDLFSGCGGFGLGAELAGFHSAVAIDIDPTLQSAYSLNFPNTTTKQADISKVTREDWKEWLDGEKPDGVIGGPPCQGFSRMGVRDRGDPRNSLVGHFYRVVSELQPKFFVMENVEGILDDINRPVLEEALEIVEDDYTILPPMTVTASDYGAPTSRRRVIVVGYKESEARELQISDFVPDEPVERNTVADALSDLPTAVIRQNSDGFVWAEYRNMQGKTLSEYAKHCRAIPKNGMGDPVSIARLRKRNTSGHETTMHSEKVAKRYSDLRQGEIDKVSKAKRLEWTGFCPTLRAGTGSDKGSHQAVRPIHPEEGRVITVREAARLQGFPDWFQFHPTKWHSFRMIGNSVSPKVSYYLLSRIFNAINSTEWQDAA